MKLCIAYMMNITISRFIAIDIFLTKFRSFLTFCYFFIKSGPFSDLRRA